MPIPIDPFLGHLMRTLFHLPEVMYEPFRNTFQALLVPRLQIAQQVQALVSKRLTFKFGSVVVNPFGIVLLVFLRERK